jgi:Mg-chelatase subunit ChlD
MTDIVKQPMTAAASVKRLMDKRKNGTLTVPLVASFAAPLQQRQVIPRVLLLDISSSMKGRSEDPDVTRIEALRKLVVDMKLAPGQPVYTFSYLTERCDPNHIPEPSGGTNLTGAFKKLKEDGHKSVVLITDGEPDNPKSALEEARGFSGLEIFYVGSGQQPSFLKKLAKAGGGSACQVSMDPQLSATVRKLLTA